MTLAVQVSSHRYGELAHQLGKHGNLRAMTWSPSRSGKERIALLAAPQAGAGSGIAHYAAVEGEQIIYQGKSIMPIPGRY